MANDIYIIVIYYICGKRPAFFTMAKTSGILLEFIIIYRSFLVKCASGSAKDNDSSASPRSCHIFPAICEAAKANACL